MKKNVFEKISKINNFFGWNSYKFEYLWMNIEKSMKYIWNMLLPMIKTHDGVLKNTIKTFFFFFYLTPVLPRCDVIIWTKFYKNANISSTTNGKLTKSVSNFRKFNNPSNELSLKWIISTCRTPWSVLIASGRFFEENYRRADANQRKNM